MDHYLDIRVQAGDPEMGCNQLMAHLFYKVHVWIAANKHRRIGLSFPAMQLTPGEVLRVHGSAGDLQAFESGDWRKTLWMWLSVSPVGSVPVDASHCAVRRIQHKTAGNRRKRSIAKGWLTAEQAVQRIPDSATKAVSLPFLDIHSASNGQRVRFYIQQNGVAARVDGEFSSYGMGKSGTTVPWF